MSEMKSYRHGTWFGIFGDHASVILPPSEKRRVAGLWELVDDGAGFDEVLDALIASGLRDLPGFVLVSEAEDGTKVVLRGPATASFSLADGEQVTLDGTSAATWVERSFGNVVSMTVSVDEGGDAADERNLEIGSGLVRVSRVDEPPHSSGEAAAPVLTAVEEPAAETEPSPDADEPEATEQDRSDAAGLPPVLASVPGPSSEALAPDDPFRKVEDPAEEEPTAEAPAEPLPAYDDEVAPDEATGQFAPSALDDPLHETPAPAEAPIQEDEAAPVEPLPADASSDDDVIRDFAGEHGPVHDTPAPPQDDAESPTEVMPVIAADAEPPGDQPVADQAPVEQQSPADVTAPAPDEAADDDWQPIWRPVSEPETEEPAQQAEAPAWDQVAPEPQAAPEEGAAPPSYPPANPFGQEQAPAGNSWEPAPAPANPFEPAPEAPAGGPPQDAPLVSGGSAPAPPGPQAPQVSAPDDVDHDGHTRAGGWDPSLFQRQQPGIPGQPQAPSVTARPVARLLFSSGDTVDVDRAILIGRAPEARRFTSTDQPRLVTVPSPNQEISSTHLEIRPGSGADHGSAIVTDMGSTNGTVLTLPGLGPEDLQPGIAVQLIPGAVVDLGDGVTIQVTNP